MIWREMINKSCLIEYCANIKKDVAWGSVVLQEQLNPGLPEGMVIFALNVYLKPSLRLMRGVKKI
jgi:hypothetical protein